MEIKTKVNKWDLIKLKCFCTAKESIIKVKRQPSEWEEIIAKETTGKRLISKIYKQFIQLNHKNNKPNQKIRKRPKQTFLHFIHVPQLLYPFICQWTWGCFHVLAIVNIAAMNNGVHVSFSILFAQGICLGVGLLGHK